ncbi:hypothetical protein E4O73_04835 [Neisseria meningitidis]|nr:hypothetical protein A6J49_13315 [Neisseria meningitidis]MBG8636322.1 hypothetical protein [Neisseria meningitidis]MBG8680407.1 hypothetical protein [Neisseria meningitidis]MBG8681345.1 hypothetical protein [Neisseria meningitidis]MBG8710424.1 hypothetical protein [Neisseria meningitidis]
MVQVSVWMDSSFPRKRESGNPKPREFIGKTETAPPSFPRRRESRSVGAETYRIKRFLQILRSGFPLSWE